VTESGGYCWGTGRRKSSVARVRIRDGKGKIQVNGKEVDNFFPTIQDQTAALAPLVATGAGDRFDVWVNVRGGGTTGQAGATSLGLARALTSYEAGNGPQDGGTIEVMPDVEEIEAGVVGDEPVVLTPITKTVTYEERLREANLLTRDSRKVERKKYGRHGARRGFQWAKR
jgi:small subunit ribosomal protein S9